MGPSHAFVDESVRSEYLLCAVIVRPSDVAQTRRALRCMRRPGQVRVHMKHESDPRRRRILSAVSDLDVTAHVYRARLGRRSARGARDECLVRMTRDLLALEIGRLCIETCEQDHRDNQVIREQLTKTDGGRSFGYRHDRPSAEPLLWLPDIVAGAFGRGADWRRRAAGVIGTVSDVGS